MFELRISPKLSLLLRAAQHEERETERAAERAKVAKLLRSSMQPTIAEAAGSSSSSSSQQSA